MPNPEKIRRVLFDRRMSKADLARKMGVSRSFATHITKSGVDIRESTLKRLCDAMGCKAEDIW